MFLCVTALARPGVAPLYLTRPMCKCPVDPTAPDLLIPPHLSRLDVFGEVPVAPTRVAQVHHLEAEHGGVEMSLRLALLPKPGLGWICDSQLRTTRLPRAAASLP